MTSLSSQLQQLAINVPTSKTHPEVRNTQSLLFSSFDKEALDKEVLLSLAENGLSELAAIDNRFAEMRPVLFSTLGQHLESSVTDRNANEELKEQIAQYFVLLTPYVQRKCALKTLEWLLTRFQDLVTVSSEFVLMILPCHELKAFRHFAKVVDKSNIWYWIKEYCQGGQSVSKRQLQLFLSRNLDQMLNLTNFVIKLNEAHFENLCKVYNSFITVTFLGVIEHKSKKRGLEDSFLSSLLDIIKKMFLSNHAHLKVSAVTLLTFIFTKTQIETKVLRKLFIFICKHVDAECQEHAFKLFLAAASSQTNFLENCGKVLPLLFADNVDAEKILADINCNSCQSLQKVVKQGLADPIVLANESFVLFVESYFTQSYNSNAESFISKIKELVPPISTECTENWQRLIRYVGNNFGLIFNEVVGQLRDSNPDLVDKIENEVPSLASAHKKLAKVDENKLAKMMQSQNEKDQASLENFKDGLKQTFLYEKSDIGVQLLKKFREKLLLLLGVENVVQCFYQRSLKLISENLKEQEADKKSSSGSSNMQLLDNMKKFLDDNLLYSNRAMMQGEFGVNVEMKLMVLRKLYSFIGAGDGTCQDLGEERGSLEDSLTESKDWLLHAAESSFKQEHWNECAILHFILLSNGCVDEMETQHSLLQRVSEMSANTNFSPIFKVLKQNLKILQKYPQELSFFESCLVIMLESKTILQCLDHFQFEDVDKIESDTRVRIAFVAIMQIINCVPTLIPSIIKSVGIIQTLNVLLAILYLPKSLFDSASVQMSSQMACWGIISKFLANVKKLPDFNLFSWPILCGLSAKYPELRALVIDFCHVLISRYGKDAVIDHVINHSEELKADKKYVEKMIADISSNMPANLEDLILTARKYQSKLTLAKVVPLLVRVENDSAKNLLRSTLKARANEPDRTSIEICCVIVKRIPHENIQFYSEALLSCLTHTAAPEVISAAVSTLTAEIFETLADTNRMEVLVRLGNLAKYDKQLGGSVKAVMKQLPLNVATLRLCFGLPEYSSFTKPRRSRVDSFSVTAAHFDKIQIFLQYLREYDFDDENAKEVTSLLNSLLASLERSHIAQETTLLQSLILNTVCLLKEFLHRYSIEGTDRVDIDIVLSLIKLFDDINLRSQCFQLIMEDFCLNSHQKSTEEQCRMAIRLFTILCESLASHEDEFSFQLIVRSIQQLLLPLCKSKSLALFLPHLVQSLKMHSSQRQVLLLQTCMGVKRFKKSEFVWQLMLSVFLESCNSVEVQNSVLIACQALETQSVELTMQCLSMLLSAADHLLGANTNQASTQFQLGCLSQLTEKRKRFTVLQMVALIPTVINSDTFVDKLAQIGLEDSESIRDYDHLFQGILELVFQIEETLFAQNVSKSSESVTPEEMNTSGDVGENNKLGAEQVKWNFSRTLEIKIQAALKAVDRLLDDTLFFDVIFKLLQSETFPKDEHVRRALQLLNIRISRDMENFLQKVSIEKIESMYKILVGLINNQEGEENDKRICQQALNILTKLFQHRPMMVDAIAEEMSKLLVQDVSVNIRVQIYALVSQIVISVKKAFLPYLSDVIVFVIDVTPFRLRKNSILFESALFCISTLLQNVSDLLGPHLQKISTFLLNMVEFDSLYSSSNSLSSALELLSQTNWRTLIPALSTVFESLQLSVGTESAELFTSKVVKFCKLLNDTIEFQETSNFENMTAKLEDLFLILLNLRQKLFASFNSSEEKEHDFGVLPSPSPRRKKVKFDTQKEDSSDTKKATKRKHPESEGITDHENKGFNWKDFTLSVTFVNCESSIFEPVVSYILRRTRFAITSFLFKLHEWACNEKSPRRKLTFFHFLNYLADKIKGLMLFFIPQYVHSFIQCLSSEGSSSKLLNSEEVLLVNKNIIHCLTTTMSYDVEPVFATAEKVEQLLPVILGQWDFWLDESRSNLSQDSIEDMVQNIVCACLAQLMVSCRDEESRSALHRKVLSYSDHSKVVVRKAVLLAIRNIATRLQEEYSMFYPEAVPFLAQLKEDSNESLVMECDSTLKTIEHFVGEAVYEHFPRME